MKIKHFDIRYFKGLESISVKDCGRINALIGKNNSGKSSILHALEIAGIALRKEGYALSLFPVKLDMQDLFSAAGAFEMAITYPDDRMVRVHHTGPPSFSPSLNPQPDDAQRYRSVLILPDPVGGLLRRQHQSPKNIMSQIEGNQYSSLNALDMLYAIKYYAERNQRGLTPESYANLIGEIRNYFPDIETVDSDRTEEDIATLTYTEYGKTLDILYAGSGLRHFLDVLVKVTLSKANVVLIDEPEHSLHPDLQRQFFEYLRRLADEKNVQVFVGTHSQVILNYADSVTSYRVINRKGNREVVQVPEEAIHTLLSDIGIRPSDFFNQDICLMVEGATDVIFFEHIIRELYAPEFDKVAIAVLQYAGGAAEGIVSGSIDVSNIVPAQKYTYWIRDRDAKPSENPHEQATKFINKLERACLECHILKNREVEYYFPEAVHIAAQDGNQEKADTTLSVLNGDQGMKYSKAVEGTGICIPSGKNLRNLLKEHLTAKEQLNEEIIEIVEGTLIPWKKEILGE
ncbi:MAG: AAA family ATPase [Actinobacteria bacterium]|nr:AAA family ATPase [Actinomycetota bacterium]